MLSPEFKCCCLYIPCGWQSCSSESLFQEYPVGRGREQASTELGVVQPRLCHLFWGCSLCSGLVNNILEVTSFLTTSKAFPVSGKDWFYGKPQSKAMERQRNFGKIKPKAIIWKWSKANQPWSFTWTAVLALNIWPWKLNNWVSEVKKINFHHEECMEN